MKSANRKTQKRKATESPISGASEQFKFIVTGFNSFGINLENPSGLTAVNLPSELAVGRHQVEIEAHLLETCCKSSWKVIRSSLIKAMRGSQRAGAVGKDKPYTVLLMLGLAAVRSTLNLERLALNLRDYPIKDNHGHKFDGEQILADGPLAITTDYPLPELRKRLNSKGFPAHISNHCGTFVCNDVFYQSLTFRNEYGSPDLILFVHVPPARVYAQTVRDDGNGRQKVAARPSKSKQHELMQAAILEVIKFTVEHVSQNKRPHDDAQRLLKKLARSGNLSSAATGNGNGNGSSKTSGSSRGSAHKTKPLPAKPRV
jgi:pyroglutamyl-peptidase